MPVECLKCGMYHECARIYPSPKMPPCALSAGEAELPASDNTKRFQLLNDIKLLVDKLTPGDEIAGGSITDKIYGKIAQQLKDSIAKSINRLNELREEFVVKCVACDEPKCVLDELDSIVSQLKSI